MIHLKKTSDLWKNSEKIVMYNDFNSQWDCVYFGCTQGQQHQVHLADTAEEEI